MMILMSILFIFGVCETIFNLLFLINAGRGRGYASAIKFHGDFPPNATNQAWMSKILLMLLMGILALITTYFIYRNLPLKTVLLYIFTAGMLFTGISQALVYGRKHLPAFGSLIVGLVFLALACSLH